MNIYKRLMTAIDLNPTFESLTKTLTKTSDHLPLLADNHVIQGRNKLADADRLRDEDLNHDAEVIRARNAASKISNLLN